MANSENSHRCGHDMCMYIYVYCILLLVIGHLCCVVKLVWSITSVTRLYCHIRRCSNIFYGCAAHSFIYHVIPTDSSVLSVLQALWCCWFCADVPWLDRPDQQPLCVPAPPDLQMKLWLTRLIVRIRPSCWSNKQTVCYRIWEFGYMASTKISSWMHTGIKISLWYIILQYYITWGREREREREGDTRCEIHNWLLIYVCLKKKMKTMIKQTGFSIFRYSRAVNTQKFTQKLCLQKVWK